MSKRVRIALAVFLVAIAGGIGWRVRRNLEPAYQDHKLTFWLEQYAANQDSTGPNQELYKEAETAIRHIGTNALPTLLVKLRARDTRLSLLVATWAQKQKLVHFGFTSPDQRHREAVAGYEALGPLAVAHVPRLIDVLSDDPLTKVRRDAASALGYIGPEARAAGPALYRATKDADDLVRNNTFWALSRISPDPQLAIPVLIAGLDDTHMVARENAATALGKYGPQAKAAVPALVRTLQTNRAAGFGLKQIDPEAAAKAGVK